MDDGAAFPSLTGKARPRVGEGIPGYAEVLVRMCASWSGTFTGKRERRWRTDQDQPQDGDKEGMKGLVDRYPQTSFSGLLTGCSL